LKHFSGPRRLTKLVHIILVTEWSVSHETKKHIDTKKVDIQPPGTNLYLKYEFIPATPATAVGKTGQPT
jgi:hypothetical protein